MSFEGKTKIALPAHTKQIHWKLVVDRSQLAAISLGKGSVYFMIFYELMHLMHQRQLPHQVADIRPVLFQRFLVSLRASILFCLAAPIEDGLDIGLVQFHRLKALIIYHFPILKSHTAILLKRRNSA